MLLLWSGLCCIPLIAIMMSITTVIQYIHKYKTQADSVVSDTNGFINSWLGFMATRGEIHNSYNADHTTPNPPQRAAHLVMFKISIGRDPKTPTTSFNGQNPTLASMVHSQLILFKILKFSGPSLLSMMSSTLQLHFLSGGLLWQWWLSYPLRASVICIKWLYTWTKILE